MHGQPTIKSGEYFTDSKYKQNATFREHLHHFKTKTKSLCQWQSVGRSRFAPPPLSSPSSRIMTTSCNVWPPQAWSKYYNRQLSPIRQYYSDIIFANNHLGAQLFFMYVYFYSLHVSGSHVPIIRRINCINATSGICHSVQMRVWWAGLDQASRNM